MPCGPRGVRGPSPTTRGSRTTSSACSCRAPRIRPARSSRSSSSREPRRCAVRRPLATLLALALVAGCDPDYVVHHVGWFSTMRHQRNIKPYAMPRSPAPGTIPVTGHEVDSLTLAAAERLVNPRTRTSESLNRGKVEFETYCLVCHGEKGL